VNSCITPIVQQLGFYVKQTFGTEFGIEKIKRGKLNHNQNSLPPKFLTSINDSFAVYLAPRERNRLGSFDVVCP